jgi:hypothetical protein
VTLWSAVCAVLIAPAILARAAPARDVGDPIRLRWEEGDVSGFTSIHSADGERVIGFVEYTQSRRGDVLRMVRVSRFTDGSSDEDRVEATVVPSLRTLRGESIIRDATGHLCVDLTIDVANGHIGGFSDIDGRHVTYDEITALPAATYWGPLVFLVLKNFDENAEDGRVRFRTVVPTPQPRVLDLEILRKDRTQLTRPGGSIEAVRFGLQPTFNRLVDPLVHLFVPATTFFIVPTTPPSLARFAGPRNYAGQEIRLE